MPIPSAPWSPSRMRGPILYLRLVWISAFAKMTEGVLSLNSRVIPWPMYLLCLPCALVTLAYAGAHSCLTVKMDFRIRENDGRGSFPSFPFLFRVIPCSSVASAFFAFLHFRVIPCSSVANESSLLFFISVFVRGKCIFFAYRHKRWF